MKDYVKECEAEELQTKADLAQAEHNESVLEREIWNKAVEACALIVEPNPHVDEERRCQDIAEEIRKLKK